MDTIDAIGRIGVVAGAVVGAVIGIVVTKRSMKRGERAKAAALQMPPPAPGELDALRDARPGITAGLFVKLFVPATIAVALIVACALVTGRLQGGDGMGVFFISIAAGCLVLGVTAIVLPKPGHDICPGCLSPRNYNKRDAGLRLTCRKCGRQWPAGTCPRER